MLGAHLGRTSRALRGARAAAGAAARGWEAAIVAVRCEYESRRFTQRRDSLRNECALGEIPVAGQEDARSRALLHRGPAHRVALSRISNRLAREGSLAPARANSGQLLAGVTEAFRVESGFHRAMRRDGGRRPLPGQLTALEDADAVLARDRPAQP